MQRAAFGSQDGAMRYSGGAPVTPSRDYRGAYAVSAPQARSYPPAAAPANAGYGSPYTQAARAPDMSSYRTGQAQPVQQSQGTAYSPEQPADEEPYTPRGGVVAGRPRMSPVVRPIGIPDPRPVPAPVREPVDNGEEVVREPAYGGVVGSRPRMSPVVRPLGLAPRQPAPAPSAGAASVAGDNSQPIGQEELTLPRGGGFDGRPRMAPVVSSSRALGPGLIDQRPSPVEGGPGVEYSNHAFAKSWNEAMSQYANTPGMRYTPAQTFGGGGAGNLAYANNRPEPFVSRVTAFGSQMDPQDFLPQRDAFIQRLNEERGRLSAQAGVYYPGEQPTFYRPRRDFGALWQRAGSMVKNGWKNPLAGLFG